MAYENQIEEAIKVHVQWKERLSDAVHSHTTDTPVEIIARDDCCDFGRWLHGSALTVEEKLSQRYKLVHFLHAEFHKVAAEVVVYALTNDSANAQQMMSESGRYSVVSKRLVAAMEDWKKIAKTASKPTESSGPHKCS